jgi:hypothetical protein
MSTNGGIFPDDQNPERPFSVEKTLGAMRGSKRTVGPKWAFLKEDFAFDEEAVRKFYERPDARVVKCGDVWAVWMDDGKPSEEDIEDLVKDTGPFLTPEPGSVASAAATELLTGLLDGFSVVVPNPKPSTQPAPSEKQPFAGSAGKPPVSKLNDLGFQLFKIQEEWLKYRGCGAILDKLLEISDMCHAQAAAIERDSVREQYRKSSVKT